MQKRINASRLNDILKKDIAGYPAQVPPTRHRRSHARQRDHLWKGPRGQRQARLSRARPGPGRIRPQGNRPCRDRNARPGGHPRGIQGLPAPQGRSHRRVLAHDHPDGRAHRDSQGSRRRHPLVLLQHLQHARPCRRGHRRPWHPRVRRQGRIPGRILGLLLEGPAVGRQRHPQHDPGRRRRLDAFCPPRTSRREGRLVPGRGSRP